MKNQINSIQNDVNSIRDILQSNIEKMLGNHESLEDLLVKAEKLRYEARVFKKRSRDLYEFEKPWYRRKTFIAKLIGLGLLIVAAITVLTCGITHIMSANTAIGIALAVLTLGLAAHCAYGAYKKL